MSNNIGNKRNFSDETNQQPENKITKFDLEIHINMYDTPNVINMQVKKLYDLLVSKNLLDISNYIDKIDKELLKNIINGIIHNATIIQHALIMDCEYKIIQLLLKNNADIYKNDNVNSIFNLNETTLIMLFHVMIERDQEEEYYDTFLSQLLIRSKTKESFINIINSNYYNLTCLEKAVLLDNENLINLLYKYNIIYYAKMIQKNKNLDFYTSHYLQLPNKIQNAIINGVFEKRSIVQIALITKNINLVLFLIKQGANLFLIPKQGNSIFHLAIYETNILKQLLKIVRENFEPKDIPEEMMKVLYYAIFENKCESLKILLEEHIFKQHINTTIMNITPLHVALGEGHFEILKLLINNGGSTDIAVQKDQLLPIHIAAAKNNYESFKYLIKHLQKKVDDNLINNNIESHLQNYLTITTKNGKMTPLHYASFRGNSQIVDHLLKLVPNSDFLNQQSATGMTALIYAITEGHQDTVKTLLSYKPNLFLKDVNGNDAITYVGYKNNYHSAILLMNYINQYKYSLLGQDIVFITNKYLLLSIIDTSSKQQVIVVQNPTFGEFIKDINNIRKILDDTSTIVKSKDFEWKKRKSLKLQYQDNSIATLLDKYVGIDYNYNAKQLILNSHLFKLNDNGTTYNIANVDNYQVEFDNMYAIGYYLALIVLYRSINLPLDDYIFKVITQKEQCNHKLLEALTLGFYELIPIQFLKITDQNNEISDLHSHEIVNWETIKNMISY